MGADVASSILGIARGIAGLLSPLMGEQASGRIFVTPKNGVNESTRLDCNEWFYAEVRGEMRPNHLLRVLPNIDEPDTGHWTIPPEGRLVRAETIQGGSDQNLPDGTPLTPVGNLPWLESAATAETFTGGSDVTDYGARVNWIGVYESMQDSQKGLDLFRAGIGEPPAIVIVWGGAEPADGISSSSIDRGRNRKGNGKLLEKEQFSLHLILTRVDSAIMRREEGFRILHEMRSLLVDQFQYGGDFMPVRVSQDDPIQFRRAFRATGPGTFFDQYSVLSVQYAATVLWEKRSRRKANPWRMSAGKITGTEPNPGGETDRFTYVEEQRSRMPQDGDG